MKIGLVLLSSWLSLSMIAQIDNTLHLGGWEGYDGEQVSQFHFLLDDRMFVIYDKDTIGLKPYQRFGEKVVMYYTINYQTTPYEVDFIIEQVDGEKEVGRIKGIMDFVNDKRCKILMNDEPGGERPVTFDDLPKHKTLFLDRIMPSKKRKKWAYVYRKKEKKKTKVGIINEMGQEILPSKYDKLVRKDGYYFAQLNGKYGCMDLQQNIIIPFEYDGLGMGFESGLIKAMKKRKWGYLSKQGAVRIKFKYRQACDFSNGKAYVRKKKKTFYIDSIGQSIEKTEKEIVICEEDRPPVMEEIVDQFQTDRKLEVFQVDNLQGVKVRGGKEVIIPAEYDKIGLYYNGMIEVKKNGKWGIYADSGELVIEPQYSRIGIFNFE